jgi:biopolymer transport protein ExbB/TolQ
MVDLLAQWNWLQSPADFLEIWHCLGLLTKGVVVVLLVMIGQVMLTSTLAAVKHVRARRESPLFVLAMKEALQTRRFEDISAPALKFQTSHVGAVVAAGLCAFRELPRSFSNEEARECVERAMNRVLAIRTAEIRLGLSTLKTIAATAPLIGILGTLLGILNSGRGGDSRATGLMIIAGSFYIALVLTALGLVVAVLSMWAHDCVAKMSDVLAGNLKNTAFEMMEQLWAHPEWRDSRDSDTTAEPLHAGESGKYPWEVPYDRYRLLPGAVFVELCFYAVMTLMLCSTITAAGDAFAIGVGLLAVGIVALSVWSTRKKGTSAAPQDASVAEGYYHQSVERRVRARLPLRQKLAVLPDRSLVFAMPALVCLLFFVFIDHSQRIPKGIEVAIAPRETASSKMSQPALLVEVQNQTIRTGWSVQVRIQKKLIAEDELRDRLQQELARRDDRSVFIRGDEDFHIRTW